MMSGLEAVEINYSSIDLGDRYDAEFFNKEYLLVENRLAHCQTLLLEMFQKWLQARFIPLRQSYMKVEILRLCVAWIVSYIQ